MPRREAVSERWYVRKCQRRQLDSLRTYKTRESRYTVVSDMRSNTQGLNLTDSVYERLLAERIIFLGSEINDEIANRLCAQILLLAAEDPAKDISLYINSPGGSISAGMAIYDTMVLAPCDIATYAMGMAASMGQFLLAAGTKGKRYSLPHARILMHQPLGGVTGSAADIAIQAEQFAVIKKEMFRLNAEFTGQPIERIMADSDRDRWFTAQEALEYGFVDHIITNAPVNGEAR
ncbi:MAG: ATP-dependent Clp protease proteolytic subunit [Mycobacterium sp.]|uniref:ATP-dependent Clp protease proteolytic subunit n=1 Tax=Mycobacterium sp. TaxID=1785 RepID=UPI002634826E|nr:ATP-dependent Clp protease proteolytic subunit [Mycobacterium sp.]MDI3313965.1 ATP-dependent Clp protease proteolytic subunit [Mycobacterium sp.]